MQTSGRPKHRRLVCPTCVNGPDKNNPCGEATSITADLHFLDANGVQYTASRQGYNFVITKSQPDFNPPPGVPIDAGCPADLLTGLTPTPVPPSCWTYAANSITLKLETEASGRSSYRLIRFRFQQFHHAFFRARHFVHSNNHRGGKSHADDLLFERDLARQFPAQRGLVRNGQFSNRFRWRAERACRRRISLTLTADGAPADFANLLD